MTAEVTREEFDALKSVVESLVRRMDLQKTAPPPVEDSSVGIPRGKYRGLDHAAILDSDPWYIAWLVDKGLAGSFGFAEDQIIEALDVAAVKPDPRRQKGYR
jgi:hypothetical protein